MHHYLICQYLQFLFRVRSQSLPTVIFSKSQFAIEILIFSSRTREDHPEAFFLRNVVTRTVYPLLTEVLSINGWRNYFPWYDIQVFQLCMRDIHVWCHIVVVCIFQVCLLSLSTVFIRFAQHIQSSYASMYCVVIPYLVMQVRVPRSYIELHIQLSELIHDHECHFIQQYLPRL